MTIFLISEYTYIEEIVICFDDHCYPRHRNVASVSVVLRNYLRWSHYVADLNCSLASGNVDPSLMLCTKDTRANGIMGPVLPAGPLSI